EISKPKVEIKQDTLSLKSTITYTNDWANLSLTKGDDIYRMTAIVSELADALNGRLFLPNGTESTFRATKTGGLDEKEDENKENKEKKAPELVAVTYPNMAFGNTELPKATDI